MLKKAVKKESPIRNVTTLTMTFKSDVYFVYGWFEVLLLLLFFSNDYAVLGLGKAVKHKD